MRNQTFIDSWKTALHTSSFKKSFSLVILIAVLLICFFPLYFARIEERNGLVLADALLNWIPAYDVSYLIFILLYGSLIWMIASIAKEPYNCLAFIWTYVFLCLIRIVTIGLVTLDPPAGLIELRDPVSIIFYHTKSITKDLFFSGHTSILFLGALFQSRLQYKIIGFVLVFIMAGLLLIQHIHYTIDILFAPFFCLLSWYLARYFCNLEVLRTDFKPET